MKVLVTGFDAFNGEEINPSAMIVKSLKNEIDGNEIKKIIIPTVYKKSAEILEQTIKDYGPDIIISLGQAGGRTGISLERLAINIDDGSIADNEGNMPIDQKIREDGQNAYFSSLPIKAILEDLLNNGIPSAISNSAGTYVCNHVMYSALYLAEKYGNIKAGFIHLPYLPEQVIGKADLASMDLDMMVRAVEIAILISIKYFSVGDLKKSAGRIC